MQKQEFERFCEAVRVGDFRVDAGGNMHVGERAAPSAEGIRLRESQAAAAVKLREAERVLEARSREEASTVFGQLCGVGKVDFSGYRRGRW